MTFVGRCSLVAEQCRDGSALQPAPLWLKGITSHLFKKILILQKKFGDRFGEEMASGGLRCLVPTCLQFSLLALPCDKPLRCHWRGSGLPKRHHNHIQLTSEDPGDPQVLLLGADQQGRAPFPEFPLNTKPTAAKCTLPFPSI